MMFHILFPCSLAILVVHGQRFSKAIHMQPKVGYSSTVVHTHSQTNDLHSESSVKVNFQPQPITSFTNSPNRGASKYLQTSSNTPVYNGGNNFNNNVKTNSFNVGYNISFGNANIVAPKKERVFSRTNNKKIENAQVITGKSKKNEKVRAPSNLDLSPQDYVSQAFLKQVKKINIENLFHSSSPVVTQGSINSAKQLNPIREYASKFSSQSPKFTYNTQQGSFRDVNTAMKPDPIQLSPEFKTLYQTNSHWKSVSPGLEITKSVEQQVSQPSTNENRYTRMNTRSHWPSQNFNHDEALKTSQSFDFSNAHGEILYGNNDNSAEGSETFTQKTLNLDSSEYFPNQNNLDSNSKNEADVGRINIEAHIPPQLRGIQPLPLDTSLLREPILTTGFREVPKSGRVIPIHFDISNIQTAMQDQFPQNENYAAHKNYQLPQQSNTAELRYEDHDPSASKNDFRMYEKPESADMKQYRMGYNYDRNPLNYDSSDIYKIVAMRPPPVGQNVKY